MARPNAPWFRVSKNAWYATVDGKKVSLGVRGEANKPLAMKAWHKLMAEGKPMPEAKADAPTVQEVVDGFLADAGERVSPECLRQYRKHLGRFADRFGSRPAAALTVADAEAYARKPEWSPSYRNGMLGSLLSAFRWAERAGRLSGNPLQHLRKPPKASRGMKAIVSADAHALLCEAAGPFFRAFLQLLWLTGARPGEVAGLTAEAVDVSKGVAILTEHKTAHLGKSRVIFLCPEAVAILRERMAESPQGLLFPGEDGHRLSAQAIGCRLRRLCVKAGVKHCIAYGYRHSFATDALAKGVPDAQVAALLGHGSTTMLHRHYSHLTAQAQALRAALANIRQ